METTGMPDREERAGFFIRAPVAGDAGMPHGETFDIGFATSLSEMLDPVIADLRVGENGNLPSAGRIR